MHVSVIVPAAGSGKRMGLSQRKQFIEINGQPVLHYTFAALNRIPEVSEIIAVGPSDDLDTLRQIASAFSKISAVVAGGSERQYSVRHGLDAVSMAADVIMVHDGVRPFITEAMIADLLTALQTVPAAVIGCAVTDTIKEVNDQGLVERTPQRDRLRRVQTPQAMRAKVFRDCYQQLKNTDFLGTDEAMVAEHFNFPVAVIDGPESNIKITTPADLELAIQRLKDVYGGA